MLCCGVWVHTHNISFSTLLLHLSCLHHILVQKCRRRNISLCDSPQRDSLQNAQLIDFLHSPAATHSLALSLTKKRHNRDDISISRQSHCLFCVLFTLIALCSVQSFWLCCSLGGFRLQFFWGVDHEVCRTIFVEHFFMRPRSPFYRTRVARIDPSRSFPAATFAGVQQMDRGVQNS